MGNELKRCKVCKEVVPQDSFCWVVFDHKSEPEAGMTHLFRYCPVCEVRVGSPVASSLRETDDPPIIDLRADTRPDIRLPGSRDDAEEEARWRFQVGLADSYPPIDPATVCSEGDPF